MSVSEAAYPLFGTSFHINLRMPEKCHSGSLHKAMLPETTHNALHRTITITARHTAWIVNFSAPQQTAPNHSFANTTASASAVLLHDSFSLCDSTTKHHVRSNRTKALLWDGMRSIVATRAAPHNTGWLQHEHAVGTGCITL